MIAAYVQNTRLQLLTIALLIVAGLAALTLLPRTEDPRIRNRVATILTSFPGATAERVEALVTEEIEDALRRLPEVSLITSRSQAGLSVVVIELGDHITDTEAVWSSARDELADIAPLLPAAAGTPELDDERGYAYTRILALRWQGDYATVDEATRLAILGRYGDELAKRLRAVAGTDIVKRYGAAAEEIRVDLDAAKVATLGLSVDEVARAVGQADAKVAAGSLVNGESQLVVEVAGDFDSLDRLRAIPLRWGSDGVVLRLGAVAEVRRAVAQPLTTLALVDSEPSVVVAARMLPDLRIDQWSAALSTALADFQRGLPANVAVETLFDQGEYTQQRLGDLLLNILLGFTIILAVLLLTLGLRAALIVAAALPLAILATLAMMNYLGLPIHQMSVTGLVVALGIMVDNAIVMADTVQRRRRNGDSPTQAALAAVRHLWLPLLGSTLTTILAFAPIVLMPGPAGEFVGGIAISVICALVSSYILSHTLVAGIGGRWLSASGGTGLSIGVLARIFRASLLLGLRYPWPTLGAAMLLPLVGFYSAGQLTEQFFPPSDRDMFRIEVRLSSAASLAATRSVVERIDARLAQRPELISHHWFIGSSPPPFYYNVVEDQDGVSYYAAAMVTAQDFRAANRLIPQLQRELDDAFPQAQVLVRKLEQGPPFDAPVEVRLLGPDLTELRRQGEALKRILLATEEVTHVHTTLAAGTPKVRLLASEDQANRAGLPLSGVADQLQRSLTGYTDSGSILQDTESLPVRIRVGDGERESPADLAALYLAAGDGGEALPITALGPSQLVASKGVIPRRNGERVNDLWVFIRADVLPETVLARVRANLAASDWQLPMGYRLEIGGESAERNQAVANLLASVGLIMTLLLAVVVLSFNSFRLAGLIMTAAFLAVGLGIWCVYLFGYPFGFTVIIGLMGLMGLAINAAIVILAELKSDPLAVAGEPEAIVAGVMNCTRHITSTTITTVGGFMPLILAGGGFWPPFAIAIAGGTLLTTLLSFYFVPAAFRVMARRRPFAYSPEGEAAPEVSAVALPRVVVAPPLQRAG